MANSCVKAVSFFGVVQRMYTLFASSTKRWKIFQDHVHGLTLKPLSTTRWESHINSVKAIITQTDDIREALFELSRVSEDAKTKSEAESLATHELENFEFLLGMSIWHNILKKIDLVSQKLQYGDMQIDVAIKHLKGLVSYFVDYREHGFTLALLSAKEIASKMEIDPVFPEKRQSRRKKQFDENDHKETFQSAEESFRVNYFLVVVDAAISSLRSRNLEVALTHDNESDINADDLFSELEVLQMYLPKETKTAIEVLDFVKVVDCFPNVSIAYRIILTLPKIKNFSMKIKKIKNFEEVVDDEVEVKGAFCGRPCVQEEVYSLHYDNQAFDEYSKIEFPIAPKQELYNQHLRVVGTCNGLICLADDIFCYGDDIFIWNPAIRKLVTLPCPGVTYMTHGGYESDASIGFGFDANTNDYKVVRLVNLLDMSDDSTTVAEIYSIATGSWTSLDFVSPSCILRARESQAFVNGTLHWPVLRRTDYGNEYFILTFDVSSKLFCEMPVPKSLICDFKLGLQLSVSGDGKSIALFSMDDRCEDRFLDIWVMKEYGIKESWTKLITLGPQGPERLLPRALCFRKSGEVLLMLCGAREDASYYDYTFDNYHIKSKHELVSLDLVNKTVKDFGVPGEGYQYCSVDSFKEVLVLLDQTDAVSY
ncbi:uncharacterized protein LOC110761765 [Prunus avium]|uniref:Uncharacterized protein LOC110761765 n=1 Tax=Prunus avium TaxID=42229 RepID=A0A6P5ST51_PRUAV|nr:uncharacterized protein LOC110761765 [Prunus avium]